MRPGLQDTSPTYEVEVQRSDIFQFRLWGGVAETTRDDEQPDQTQGCPYSTKEQGVAVKVCHQVDDDGQTDYRLDHPRKCVQAASVLLSIGCVPLATIPPSGTARSQRC